VVKFKCVAGEVLANALPYLERKIHPIVIIQGFNKALEDAVRVLDEIGVDVDVNDESAMVRLIQSTIGTKFISRWSDLMCSYARDLMPSAKTCRLALQAVKTVSIDSNGKRDIDIKRYARVEKVTLCSRILTSDSRG
jgi:T-complex protein 1 subunit gamma